MSFVIATSIDEALAALAAGARPIAGGTDLVVGARHGKAALPANLVAIDRIEALLGVHETADGVSIGACVAHRELESHPLLASVYSGLADASALVGSPSTRNLGTIGGNIMNASPAMDTGAPLLVLGAQVELQSVRGSRRLSLPELWTGPGRTSAAPGELCVAVHIATPPVRSGSAYIRLEYRRSMEIAVVGAAASVVLDEDGFVVSASVALTAVAPTIIVVDGLHSLAGANVPEAAVRVGVLAAEQATPISDLRASDRYRRHTVGVMARRAVEAAARRASGVIITVPLNRAIGIGAAS